ncbi:MAG: type II toxin-antitoxin system RelE/ParE family toxin [Deltaproteobacteria bacterium]|nr:type II toxin-antitoxin system RelE/ParE family toxin [Deltaproteobacteria bacterium]
MAYSPFRRLKFYLLGSGRSPVEEFLREQSEDIRTDFLDVMHLLASGQGLSMPLSRNLSGIYPGLHELRLKDRHGQVRIFYFVKRDDAVYMLHAMRKKTQEIPKRDIELILKRIKEV